ncbi:MAG TPA: zf-HC2 domain-containing protein [Pyrinomonadaceae bacterium]|nr:zf-HC2 domain-containing protein [Pyrinomonadaceae bacterium]
MALQPYNKVRHAVRYWLLRRLPTCKEIAPLMSESMERRLTARERVALRVHLWVCVWCEWYLQHLRLMREALRQRAAQSDVEEETSPASASLSNEARERLKRALASKNQ